METVTFEKNKFIFRKGDRADCMYYIKSGKVNIFMNCGSVREQILAVLGEGEYFGEMGIIEMWQRSADAVTAAKTVLVRINSENFTEFAAQNTDYIISMMRNISKSNVKTFANYRKASLFIEKHVASGELCNRSLQHKLDDIAEHSKIYLRRKNSVKTRKPRTEYTKGELILKAGETPDCLFRIVEGCVKFYLNYKHENQFEHSALGAGEIFAEMSLLERERSEFTAVAATNVTVEPVMREDFKEFIQNKPENAVIILRNLSSKLRATTDDYLEILRNAAAFVNLERPNCQRYTYWNTFVEYNEIYASYIQRGMYTNIYYSDFYYGF